MRLILGVDEAAVEEFANMATKLGKRHRANRLTIDDKDIVNGFTISGELKTNCFVDASTDTVAADSGF